MPFLSRLSCKETVTEFSTLFYNGDYMASNGKKNPMYYMNRDGFTLLVMGYTGEKVISVENSRTK
ncbi:MAG: Rha family transcriptional regulator [Lachnospiraceae bacterium]|nr:Rha family transcriptional regulator [Lachnospiraceae bacterium]